LSSSSGSQFETDDINERTKNHRLQNKTACRTDPTGSDIEKQALLESFIHPLRFDGNPFQCTQFFSEPTTTRLAGGLETVR